MPGGHARQSAELLEPAARVVDPCGQVTHAPEEIEPVIGHQQQARKTRGTIAKHGRHYQDAGTLLQTFSTGVGSSGSVLVYTKRETRTALASACMESRLMMLDERLFDFCCIVPGRKGNKQKLSSPT